MIFLAIFGAIYEHKEANSGEIREKKAEEYLEQVSDMLERDFNVVIDRNLYKVEYVPMQGNNFYVPQTYVMGKNRGFIAYKSNYLYSNNPEMEKVLITENDASFLTSDEKDYYKENRFSLFLAILDRLGFREYVLNNLLYDESKGNNFSKIEKIFDEYKKGKIVESEIPEETTDTSDVKVSDNLFKTYFDDDKFVVKKSSNTLENEFKRKKGLAMHYYFEHILNDLENDKIVAKSALYSRYGNMLGKKIVEDLIERLDKFISKNLEMYSSKYKVYTEFEILNADGEKRIIDRINIDEKNKKIYIYDYKTGFEPETNEKYQEQINEYKEILKNKIYGYEIVAKLLEV